MKKIKKAAALLLTAITIGAIFSGCTDKNISVRDEEFRVTAYAIGNSVADLDTFQAGYIDGITDVILFGVATFDEEGKITLDEKFDVCYKNIKQIINNAGGRRLYINLLGPGNQSNSDDWNDQMNDLSQRYTNAFRSGNLISNIQGLLDEYDFDGVYFDYEYPLKRKYWREYNKFIVELDEALGDGYKIGVALASWNIGMQSKKARDAIDYVEIMSYDLFDDKGDHASMEQAKKCIDAFIKKGYDPEKLDLGLPFYGRPTDHGGYWYGYGDYYQDIAEDGTYQDAETGLEFYFNTYDVIREKTSYAYDKGLGGVMVWAWSYDAKYGEEKALFNAIAEAKAVVQMQKEKTEEVSA